MTDRNRSIVRQGRRDVAPTRSPSRSVVPEPQHAPDIVRQPPARESRHDVTGAPDLKWRAVPYEERRHTTVPASRREVEVRPQHMERQHQQLEPYVGEYDYDRPVRFRHRVSNDGRDVNISVHVENRNDVGRSEGLSDATALLIGSIFAGSAFLGGLILAIMAHH